MLRGASVLTAAAAVVSIGAATHTLRGRTSGDGQTQLPTTVEDFFQPGTQENPPDFDELLPSWACSGCHEYDDDGNPDHVVAPFDTWVSSMMAQAARDPVWHAALAVANQDANASGETCIRCHAPNAWLGGRSMPPDTSGFEQDDFDSISCHFCHRLVNPEITNFSPLLDYGILRDLARQGVLPDAPGNGRYVVDPSDVRRGPRFDVPFNMHGVPILYSWVHTQSALCGTCHDVSNPVYTRQEDGTYALNDYDMAHPTQDQHEMMPEQRTYSEWLNSRFARGGVPFPDGRFGGDHPTGLMQTCQDCHMPRYEGGACAYWEIPPFFKRPDIPQHTFAGANTWVLESLLDLYPEWQTGLSRERVDTALAGVRDMLRAASDLLVAQYGPMLRVRLVNFSGHKLPTGYPEGRRIWLNVRFFGAGGDLIAEHGAYDFDTGDLETSDTKVYEMKLGMTREVADATGLPPGESFHLVLNNKVHADNRIPPIGFTNEAFAGVRAEPVNYTYADGQYWDDTDYPVPAEAASVVVTAYYQTSSKEYIEFLRDANVTNDKGRILYDTWADNGRSAPVDMDARLMTLGAKRIGDLNRDGVVDFNDALLMYASWGPYEPPALKSEDLNHDGRVDFLDVMILYANFS
jgi:hypothetical protein